MLDFGSPEAAGIINAWVREKTREKIPTIVTPDVVAASTAILTNAIYFKAAWEHKFFKPATADAPFHLANGSEKTVPMMHHFALVGSYRKGDGFEAAELRYGDSGMSMFTILPSPGTSPEDALKNVSIYKMVGWADSSELDLKLPRFELDFSTKLGESLTAMGMGIAFQFPGADFKPLGSELFFIGEVIHKTRLEVNEEGTVAAAATAIVMRAGSAKSVEREKHVLMINRPFAVLICDSGTGAILFAGVIYEP